MFNHSNNTVVNGGTFNLNHHNVHLHSARGIDRLEAATAPAAFHDSRERFDPPKCHPHTREAILKKILEWIQRKIDTHAFVLWLYGAAGAGKSAISQTIAEICHKEGLLLASFFFSRNDPHRNTTERLVATLVYQVIVAIPGVRGLVETAVENDPLIFSRSLDTQFTMLILRPLEQLRQMGVFAQVSPPMLVILDGLDECMDGTRTHLLSLISTVAQPHGLIFLIASRKEQDIAMAIRFGSMEKILTQIALDNDYQSHEDIEYFFRDKFDEIKGRHPLRAHIPSSWPDGNIIYTLVKKSSGQFIYATTALRYVSSPRHQPTRRLDIILGINPPRNENDTPFAQLDELYMHIISSTEDPGLTARFISACLFISPLLDIEDFLGIYRGDGMQILGDLASVIGDSTSSGQRVSLLHASLGDFLSDISRSRQFHVDPRTMRIDISRWYLSVIMKGDSSSRDALIGFDGHTWDSAALHCRLTQMTPQLIDDISSVSIRNELEASLSSSPYAKSIYFIHTIKDMKFEGAKCLYEEYLSMHDRKLLSHLDNNPFTSLDVIHLKDAQLLVRSPYHLLPPVHSVLWRIFSNIFEVPDDNHHLFRQADGRIKAYIRDFVCDTTRSGRHAFHDGHYTTAAEKCAKYLLNRHLVPIQCVRTWASQSRKHPWLWKIRHPSIVTYIRAHWRYLVWKNYVKPYRHGVGTPKISWSWNPSKLPLQPLLVFHVALTSLQPLLARDVQGSTDLNTLCKKLVSGRLPFFIFPDESKVTKRAIQEYLFGGGRLHKQSTISA